MITIRKATDRGGADHGWLNTKHTFSFASYYDPEHMGYRSLRVINEDHVQPGNGFGTHSHDNMEIISYVLAGELEHKDSLGNGEVIHPNEVQVMSAGTGVRHSEFNSSKTEPVHFLQIWITPREDGTTPRYEKLRLAATFEPECRLVVSGDGRNGSATINQDADVYLARFPTAGKLAFRFRHPHGWAQVTRGAVTLNGEQVTAGDGVAIEDETTLTIGARDAAEVLLFDLA